MKYLLLFCCFLMFVNGCASSSLLELGEDKTFIYQVEKEGTSLKEIRFGKRNPWSYPLVVLLYPVALSIDVALIPYYVMNPGVLRK